MNGDWRQHLPQRLLRVIAVPWTLCLIVGSLIGVLACSARSAAQAPDSLPFGTGERLTFAIRASKFGNRTSRPILSFAKSAGLGRQNFQAFAVQCFGHGSCVIK